MFYRILDDGRSPESQESRVLYVIVRALYKGKVYRELLERVLLEDMMVAKLVNLPASYGTQRTDILFTKTCHFVLN
jgi:hypothetical protein